MRIGYFLCVAFLVFTNRQADSRGVDLGLCEEKIFQCRCGDVPSDAVRFPVKQCTFFRSWKPYCRPCGKVTEYDLCPKYRNCLRCDKNNEKDNKCTECPVGKYNNWCDADCKCQNGGSCDREGTCYCGANYEGRYCETAKVVDCTTPIAPRNGDVVFSSVKPGSRISYTCNAGHKLRGNSYNRCSLSGIWEDSIPICVAVCEIPQNLPPNMRIELINDDLKVLSKGGPPSAKATFYPESSHPAIQQGSSQGYQSQSRSTGRDDFISSIVFSCDSGYSLVGQRSLICINGQWSGSIPKCLKKCPIVVNPQNGIASISNGAGDILPGTTVTVTCNEGYQPAADAFITCLEDGKWSSDVTTCVPLVLCADPGLPEGATRESFAPYTSGKAIMYSCKDDAILIGDSTTVCQNSGEWSSEPPLCIAVSGKSITCKTSGSEVFGAVNTPIRISCPSGCAEDPSPIWGTVIYESSSSVCKAAIHSGKIKDEGGPVLVINNSNYAGFVSSVIHSIASESKDGFSSSFRFSSIPPKTFGEGGLTSECPQGWKEVDDVCILIVNKDKVWKEAEHICQNLDSSLLEVDDKKITKLQPLLLKQVNPDLLDGLSYWFRATCNSLTSKDKRSLSIVKNSPCDELKNFICQIQLISKGAKCSDPGNVFRATRTLKYVIDGVFYEGSSVTYKCTDLYYLSGEGTMKCQRDGEWSTPKPTCERIPVCEELPQPGNGALVYTEPPKVMRSGGPSSMDSRLGLPSRRFPGFRGNSPLSLTAPRNITQPADELKDVEVPDGYRRAGARALITCKSRFYSRSGSRVRTCKSNGRWSGSSASCHPICGISSAPKTSFVVNGNASDVGQWPWQAAVATWFPQIDSFYVTCGGSLISENWILTAAHCVTYQRTNIVISSTQFRVYLGKHYRNDTLDDEYVQMRSIEEIHVHPNYDYIQYDSDIALMKISTSADLTARVRPVCLPTFTSSDQNLVKGKIGVVTGWGKLEDDTYAEELQQAKVPFVPTRTCMEGYESEGLPVTITDYMFCAGYKEGKTDACSGDSGGPFVFLESATNKWTLEGIVSWGSPSGCGNQNQYGGFTRVERFLEWIQEFV
uniref:Limulus clotting factor C-like n=1 Tax=Ammothea sp. RS-2014 TaxID=1569307 RepID=A0A0E3VMY6_9CHEL|nr:limulus clotting factor C-like [Ammothea sp. RS-2014]